MTDRRRHLPKRGPNSGLALGFSSTGLLDHVLAGLEEGGEGGFFFPSPRATALFCGRQAFGVCRFIAKFMCFPIDAVFTTCSFVFLEFPLVDAATARTFIGQMSEQGSRCMFRLEKRGENNRETTTKSQTQTKKVNTIETQQVENFIFCTVFLSHRSISSCPFLHDKKREMRLPVGVPHFSVSEQKVKE